MAKEYKTHKDVEKKYKWNLDELLGGKTPNKAIEDVLNELKKEIKIKDNKYDSAESYLKYLKQEDALAKKVNVLFNYLSNSISINVIDPNANKYMDKMQYGLYQIKQELGSEDIRFFKNSTKLVKWAKLPKFKPYKFHIENKLEEKKYQLSKEIQAFRIKQSRADISALEPFSILTNSEIEFGYATTTSGKKIKITNANRVELSKHKDAKVRKTSQISYFNAFLKHKSSLSNLLYQHKKEESTMGLIEGHKSAIDALLFSDRSSRKLLETLFTSVQSNVPLVRKFNNAHKKFYKTKFGTPLTKYDKNVEMINNNLKISPEDAIKDVLNSVKPFGKEYEDKVKEALKSNWVDFMPVKNKQSGAYSIGGAYGMDKILILMNFDGTIRSAETLAHEMGHSMHSYYSCEYNNAMNSEYKIFVAEIASIFNELMYFDYLAKKSDDVKLKFKIAEQKVNGFIGTVFRQVEWANYELDLYDQIDKGVPLGSFKAISKVYFENHKKYTIKKNPKYKEIDAVPAIYVPHFYYGFYVYKYAIGQLVASIFFNKYKEEGTVVLEKYINKFLKAGGTKNPLDILKDAGVDLLNPSIAELGFKTLEDNINEYINLGKKIFKARK
ncbi:M3 family oligoendopeptidase [Candidatus Mycoplasma mahonii]|uniref:M3 family oligoendopeptidase n=1 Tax=Candidatus Mycoplasma mahonii TaxID=3004105 RepID=UPI0026E9FCB2|nr:M3 family oligoendopeptidase [Candidatus Mycoplasma mahonii]WKX02305.1 oligoendopeptidase F family protein [Candidatus Mycoplasma mahonii]